MTFEEAKEHARTQLSEQCKKAKSVIATSDGSFYLNGNADTIKAHAKDQGLEVFEIKPEPPNKKK
jgi:hypothetical protein